MNLSCVQENLQKGLQIVGRVAKAGGTLPILSNVLLKTEKGRLKLSATDLEIGISGYVGAKIEKEGSITVPARILMDCISMIPNKKLTLKADKNVLSVESDKYKTKIKGMAASEFPLIPEVKREKPLLLPALKLKESIAQVLTAPAIDETKPVLSGVCLRILGNKLKMVATDSFRLAERTIALEQEADKNQVIVPARTLSEVGRILSLVAPPSISIIFSENQILFVLGSVEVMSRIIEGSFPDYESIIPKESETLITFEVSELQNALKLAHLFAREGGGGVRLSAQKDQLVISSSAALLGENTSTISVTTEGPEVEISFNAKFLLDALSVISSPSAQMSLTGSLNPVLLKPTGRSDFVYLIMPLKET